MASKFHPLYYDSCQGIGESRIPLERQKKSLVYRRWGLCCFHHSAVGRKKDWRTPIPQNRGQCCTWVKDEKEVDWSLENL